MMMMVMMMLVITAYSTVNIFSTILLMTIFYINRSAPHPHPHHLPNPVCMGYKLWKISKIPNRYKMSNKIFNSINFNNISYNFTLLCATLRYFTLLYATLLYLGRPFWNGLPVFRCNSLSCPPRCLVPGVNFCLF